MRAGFPPDPDAEYRRGAYGSGMEEEFAESQDPVSRQIRGIGHVVGGVLRESGVKQDLGILRILLPYQTHMHPFGTLHRDQGGNLPALRRRAAGIGIREHALG